MVLLGGAIGSLTRYVVGMAVMTRLATRFPFGTMIVNVTGSFLIGVFGKDFVEMRSHPIGPNEVTMQRPKLWRHICPLDANTPPSP